MSEMIYRTVIDGDYIRDREAYGSDFEVIGPLLGAEATDSDCMELLEKVIKHASSEDGLGVSDFTNWFCMSDWYDKFWDAIDCAIDDYIHDTAEYLIEIQSAES